MRFSSSPLWLSPNPLHDGHHHNLEKLGRVTFQTSCSPQAHAIFIRGMTLASLV